MNLCDETVMRIVLISSYSYLQKKNSNNNYLTDSWKSLDNALFWILNSRHDQILDFKDCSTKNKLVISMILFNR